MKEHPILFSAPMVRALLANRKSVTRRLSPQWVKVKAGDRLWGREHLTRPDGDPWMYAADTQPVMVDESDETAMLVWAHHKQQDYCPSIHMPRWASRILLECDEDARRERLHDITEEDAMREGIYSEILPAVGPWTEGAVWYWGEAQGGFDTARQAFEGLWRTLHTKPGERWEDNPQVVRIGKFRRIA